jgi:hypothetical protein
MKKFKIITLICAILFAVSACNQKDSTPISSESRIKLKAKAVILYHKYVIIEVDSIEYLTSASGNGGFIRITE